MDFGGLSMFLQGDLQAMFDALYTVGAIDPVLKMDWNQVTAQAQKYPLKIEKAFSDLNQCRGVRDELVLKLSRMEPQMVQYIAVEVAREFCEFQDKHAIH